MCKRVNYTGIKCAVINKNARTADLSKLLKVVLEVFEVSLEDIKSKSRKRPLPDIRKAFYFLCSKHSLLNNIESPRYIGQDHSTGIYGVQECANLMRHDVVYRRKVDQCRYLFIKEHHQVNVRYE